MSTNTGSTDTDGTGTNGTNGTNRDGTDTRSGDGLSWRSFAAAEPGLARTVEERFAAHTHHVLATLRRDGSPRTTGLEVRFVDGELWFGMMPDSLKALDLRRDPRFALQANPGEGTTMGGGDVRISGRAAEVPEEDTGTRSRYAEEVEPPEPFHLFRTEITEVVRTSVEDEKFLVVQVWKPGEPVRTLKRT
ncbi:pyridoxamine 5'-phosphate oxidase family protein [Streptomyces tendae]|uniref:Pyridoxamine 5'-phosphate oxidase family protein n=1 Tax=Streptomyces tendae TaxID=1932 RepID=A0ABX5ZKA8_STRTE|nr:pyridoxamine 5'-phosphate oxidase family protein [Streptomyces tendae]